MSRINTNINSLIAQRVLTTNNKSLTQSLERLSTGLRINRGGDDPSGLIASEKLRNEKSQIKAAIGNAERAEQITNIADGGLQEVSTLLLELQGLVSQAASDGGFSDDERQANQLQIDNILATIDRISSTTTFQGTKLLNGNFDFVLSNQNANVLDIEVANAKVPDGTGAAGSILVTTIVTQSAQHSGVFLSAGATALDLTAASSTFVFELAGKKGVQQFTFGSGTTMTQIATAVNNFKDVTGISATSNANTVVFHSKEYGKDEYVQFRLVNRGGQAGSIGFLSSTNDKTLSTATAAVALTAVTNAIRDDGQDVQAVINGIKANGKGRNLSVNSEQLSVSFTLSSTLAQATGATNVFRITDGGAKFNLGPEVNLANRVTLGLRNVASRNLGNNSVGYLDSLRSGNTNSILGDNVGTAQQIVGKAIDQVTSMRGRIGSFQNYVVGSTIRALNVAYENTSAAEAAIRDTDFAAETAALTRSQILVAAANNALALANANPQNVLSLLR